MSLHGFVGVLAFVLTLLFPALASADRAIELAAVETRQPGAYESQHRRLSFDVQRKGKTIGQHVVNIREDGDQVVVDTKIDIKINIAFVTVFTYSHTGHEVWQDGKLVSLDNVSNDNGNEIVLTAERGTEGLIVHGTRFDGAMTDLTIPTSYWNTATVQCKRMFNTQNGKPMDVNVQEDGSEIIQAGGRTVEATKYTIDGDLKKQIWYDRAGTWVKSVFNVRGQQIEYVLVDDKVETASNDPRILTR